MLEFAEDTELKHIFFAAVRLAPITTTKLGEEQIQVVQQLSHSVLSAIVVVFQHRSVKFFAEMHFKNLVCKGWWWILSLEIETVVFYVGTREI